MSYRRVFVTPTTIICDVQIGLKEFKDVKIESDWENLIKLKSKDGELIGGDIEDTVDKGNLFAALFGLKEARSQFEEIELYPIRASGKFLEAIEEKSEEEKAEEKKKEKEES